MTLRIATRDDWPLILQRLRNEGFDAPEDDAREPPPRELADSLWIDDEVGAICRIAANVPARELTVAWLLPSGMSRSRLGPLLLETLRHALLVRPAAARWVIAATFPQGRDALGNLDRGEGACRAWQTNFPGATVEQLPSGYWRIRWTLRGAIDGARL